MACLIPRPETPHQPLCIPKPRQLLQTTMPRSRPTRSCLPVPSPSCCGASKMQRLNDQKKSWADNEVLRGGSQFSEEPRPGEATAAPVACSYWPELMATLRDGVTDVCGGFPCESTGPWGGPGSEMSSRAETLGGESRVLEAP